MYDGLSPDRLIFSGNSLSKKELYFLYADSEDYNVITKLKAAKAKRYKYNECDFIRQKTQV